MLLTFLTQPHHKISVTQDPRPNCECQVACNTGSATWVDDPWSRTSGQQAKKKGEHFRPPLSVRVGVIWRILWFSQFGRQSIQWAGRHIFPSQGYVLWWHPCLWWGTHRTNPVRSEICTHIPCDGFPTPSSETSSCSALLNMLTKVFRIRDYHPLQ